MNQPHTGVLWLGTRSLCIVALFLLVQLAYSYWPLSEQRGAGRLQTQVQQEYTRLHAMAAPTTLMAVHHTRRLLYRWLYIPADTQAQATSLVPISAQAGPISAQAGPISAQARPIWNAILNRLAVRLGVLGSIAPLYLLASIVAVADGLCARTLRRLAGRPESSFVYHRLKHTLLGLMLAGLAGYLCWPWAIVPHPGGAVHAVLYTILLRQCVARFKKYL